MCPHRVAVAFVARRFWHGACTVAVHFTDVDISQMSKLDVLLQAYDKFRQADQEEIA